jgi:hypothetical protein
MRRALLIAADIYSDNNLNMPAAKNDVCYLAQVLVKLDYEVLGPLLSSEGFLVTLGSLKTKICNFFEKASSEDELLLYFSGHGIEQDGHRLLLSQDYDRHRPPDPDSLVGDEFLYRWARLSPAKSVLIVIDACREGVQIRLERVVGKAPLAENPTTNADCPTVAIVYSCASGERSWANNEVQGMSFFSRAFCETLELEPEVATLNDILDSTQTRLSRLVSNARKPNQTVTLDERPIHGRAGIAQRLLLRQSPSARLQQDVDNSAWCREIRISKFWPMLVAWPKLADRLCIIVLRCELEFRQAQRCVSGDRWRDERAPTRIVKQVERLFSEAKESLTVPEMALVLVVPYVYEAVLAVAVVHLCGDGHTLETLTAKEQTSGSRMWFAWRNTWLSDEQRLRRHERLLRQNKIMEAEDLVSWHLNRFLHSNGDIWQYPQTRDDSNWINSALQGIFMEASELPQIDPSIDQFLQGRRLVRLARLMFADWREIEYVRKNDQKHPLRSDERFGTPPEDWAIDEASLAHVLSLAATMSVDPRRLDSVLADHLGMSEGFHAEMLVNKFRESVWYADQEGFSLMLNCPHEALDLALRNLVEIVDEHRRRLDTTIKITARMRDVLPQHFCDYRVSALLKDDGEPRYKLPHLQLTLDQKRVFQLLMGKSLYGDQEIALRELYQNALDACRLRRARVQYINKKDSHRRNLSYTGEIVFRVGEDYGSPFIECRDNGIGMGERHLHSLFARAGQRFTDSHEFHVEKAAWEASDVQFFPNSRFGIGVFSYFMLADEIKIETRRLGLNAIDMEPGITAVIAGGSSLFRIQPTDDLDVGTTVRLYLSRVEGLEGLLERMLRWLWLPEFDTTLVSSTGKTFCLKAGQLTQDLSHSENKPIPISTSCDNNGQPRFYWNPRLGASAILLADGILTKDNSGLSADGLIINLDGALQPELSVDRSQIDVWTKGHEHVIGCLRKSNCRELLEMPGIDLVTLACAFERWPLPLLFIDRAWREGNFEQNGIDPAVDSINSSRRLDEPISLFGTTSSLTNIRDLLATRVGLAPVFDQILLQNQLPSYSVKSKANIPLKDLFDGPYAIALGDWIAARALTLLESGCNVADQVAMLARFAATKKLRDSPSVGLLFLEKASISLSGPILHTQVLQLCYDWSLTLDEVKYFIRPLSRLGIHIPDMDSWSKDMDLERRTQSISDIACDWNRNEITVPGLLRAVLKISLPVSEIAKLLKPLASLGIEMPDVKRWKSLPAINHTQRRVLIYVLKNATSEQDLVLRLLAACADFEEAEILDLVRWLVPLSPSVKQVEAFLGNEALRIMASAKLNGQPPWRGRLSVECIFASAAKLSLTLQQARELAIELEPLGMSCETFSFSCPEDFRPTETHLLLLKLLEQKSNRVPVERLLVLAVERALTWGETVQLVQPLSELGASVPEPPSTDSDFVPTKRQIDLLSRNLDGKALDARRIPAARLVAAAIEWTVSLGEVMELARPLAKIGVQLPNINELATDFRPTQEHAIMLSKDLDGRPVWLDFLPGNHLLSAIWARGFTMDQLNDLSQPLVAIGAAAAPPRLEPELVSSWDVLEFLSCDLDGKSPWIEQATPLHVLKACVHWSKPWQEVVRLANRLQVLPADFPTLDAEFDEFRPTRRHLQALSKNLSEGSFTEHTLSLGHIVLIANRWTLSLSDVVQMLRPLEQVGIVKLPYFNPEFPVNERHLLLLSKDLDGLPEWIDQITLRHLQTAARKLSWPLSMVVQMALPLRDLGVQGIFFPECSEWVQDRAYEILDALRPFQSTLQPWEIATIAARFGRSVLDYAEALEIMALMGINVSKAESFLHFCKQTMTNT